MYFLRNFGVLPQENSDLISRQSNIHCILQNRLYFAPKRTEICDDFTILNVPHSGGGCLEIDDVSCFAPENLSTVCHFIDTLKNLYRASKSERILCISGPNVLQVTNAVFLIGAFMSVELRIPQNEIRGIFKQFNLELFRISSPSFPDNLEVEYSIFDCLQAIEKAFEFGWIHQPSMPGIWGKVDIDEYEHYRSPFNGDLVQVVPGKLILFPSPTEIKGGFHFSDSSGVRHFSVEYFAEILDALNVSTCSKKTQYNAQQKNK